MVMGWKKMMWCEHLERTAAEMRALARHPADVDQMLAKGLHDIDGAYGIFSLGKAGKAAVASLKNVEKIDRPPLKVIMVGEVYTVMEPSINMDVEKRLGHLGVIVHRSSYFSTHIRRGSRLDRKLLHERKKLLHMAGPYLNYDVGAECNFSVAEAVQAHHQGYDGVVHVYPFSCMPETNAAAVLSVVGEDLNIPVLPVVIDRQDMGLRIDTQLEAFVDVMMWQRQGRIV
jgi:predicted nucleotide-binding protein (sugar kinase/HSP70/actin superfamily)